MTQDLLGLTNGVDTLSLDGEETEDDITEPIAPCTSLPHTNGVRGLEAAHLTELATSAIPAGIECAAAADTPAPHQHVTSLEVNGGGGGHGEAAAEETEAEAELGESIIDEEGFSLDEFIVYVRNKTRNGLFDEYQDIKSNPPDGTFDHARMVENLVKVSNICGMKCPTVTVEVKPLNPHFFYNLSLESVHGRAVLRPHEGGAEAG